MPKVYLIRSVRISYTEWLIVNEKQTAYLGKVSRKFGENFPATVEIGGVVHSTELIGILGDMVGLRFVGGKPQQVDIDYVDNDGNSRHGIYANQFV